uniref:Uncharacterized protein n=1 Tax=Setaria italica TaxID=4555 RepID=K3Z247_SETIT
MVCHGAVNIATTGDGDGGGEGRSFFDASVVRLAWTQMGMSAAQLDAKP